MAAVTNLSVRQDEWDWLPLSAVCRQIVDGTHFTPRYVSSGVPFYSVENITNDDFRNTKFITAEEHAQLIRRCKPERGDILLTRIGSIGDAKLIDWDVNASIYVSLALLKCGDHVDARFLAVYMKSSQFRRDIEDRSLLNASPKKINMGDIGNVPIPIPPLNEQLAIAEALSDADALISSLEILIAKKRAIKQGVLQDLLSGQRRLPGFDDEWDNKAFSEVFDFHPTATNSRADLDDSSDTYYIHYGDIHTRFHSHLDFKRSQPPKIARTKCRNAAYVRNGDWIMADASEDYDGVCKSIEVLGLSEADRVVSGLHTFLLREKSPTFVPEFKGHLGNLNSLRDQYMRVMTGMKVFGVSKTALRDLVLPVPSPKEQEAIVTILSEMAADIAALEEKLSKARFIKQGMMQQLLTGKVRLV